VYIVWEKLRFQCIEHFLASEVGIKKEIKLFDILIVNHLLTTKTNHQRLSKFYDFVKKDSDLEQFQGFDNEI
jgi:Mn-dependent DtxR family transcriptional regulator